jgi:eukaryotic-like serine/threonine-protein kinase
MRACLVHVPAGHTAEMDDGAASGPPELAGRYELGSLLGRGGMGAVRDATDRRLGRQVAVKILRADLAEQPSARRRFETEARAAARLAHPNVVTVFDSGEEGGIPFLVMERLPGGTLADEFAAGPLSLERFGAVAGEILAALAAAHTAGIIHRDIKPGNVLLTEDGHVKVSDFGIAKTVDDIDQTQTAELVATPGYLAPERLAGEPASQRSDLYSVGVLLYEALSGRRPFEGETPLALMRAIEHGHAEPLTSLRPELPAEVIAVVERAMSRDPSRRFDSATDMAAALQPPPDLDATMPIETANGSETVPVVLPSHDGATRTLHLPNPPRNGRRPGAPRGRQRVLALGVGAALAGALLH